MDNDENIQKILEEAWALRGSGNYEESGKLLEKAVHLCGKDDFSSLGRIFHIRMQYEYDHDNFEQALKYCQKSLSYYIRFGNSLKIAHSTRHMADLQLELKRTEEAEQNYLKSIEIYKNETGARKGDLTNTLRGYGILLETKQKFVDARLIWEQIKDLYIECDFPAGVEEAKRKIYQLYLKEK